MIWISIIIPLIGALVMFIWFTKRLTWWEILIPFAAALLFTLIFKFTVEKIQTSDTEYWGALITEARYYEEWETWVKKTCSRTVTTGSGKHRTSRTVYYDCSYCDHNSAYWEVVNSMGEKFRISEQHYNDLLRKWKSTPRFIELNRHINYHLGCGKDGDMYSIMWNKDPLVSEATVVEKSYENRVQAAHTVFDFVKVTKKDILQYGLQDYPKVEGYKQKAIIGTFPSWLSKVEIEKGQVLFEHSCGYWGPKKHGKVWIVLFLNKPQLAANMQEAYWEGGNDNEVIICICLNSVNKKIDWVKPFSWTPNRKLIPDLREDIMNMKTFDVGKLKTVIDKHMANYTHKDFKEFSYLTVDPPTWAMWVTFIVVIFITVGVCWWAVTNDFSADNSEKTKE